MIDVRNFFASSVTEVLIHVKEVYRWTDIPGSGD